MLDIEKLSYDDSMLKTKCDAWESGAKCFQLSKFDRTLRSKWADAMATGCFKYNLDSVKTKVIPGKFKLVAQLNEERFAQRRKPQRMTSVSQPFDDSKFNFMKVFDKEILFEMYPLHRSSPAPNYLIINVSPLEFGNSLLVPSINSRLPQILTVDAIVLALETALLSTHRGFHVGFNSLCAFASVNHLHFHVWYLDYPSPLETIELEPLSQDVYEVCDYPTRLFACVLRESSHIPSLARKIHKITSYFIDEEIAHNLLIIRGEDKDNGSTSVRTFIWPRNSVLGAKDECMFNIAVCELGGHLPIKSAEFYDSITEQDFYEQLSSASLSNEEFENITQFVITI